MITLYNKGITTMTVMANGKVRNFEPSTTLEFKEEEASKLKGYKFLQKIEIKTEVKEAKTEDREALKAKAKELGLDFPENIKTEKLISLIEEAK